MKFLLIWRELTFMHINNIRSILVKYFYILIIIIFWNLIFEPFRTEVDQVHYFIQRSMRLILVLYIIICTAAEKTTFFVTSYKYNYFIKNVNVYNYSYLFKKNCDYKVPFKRNHFSLLSNFLKGFNLHSNRSHRFSNAVSHLYYHVFRDTIN